MQKGGDRRSRVLFKFSAPGGQTVTNAPAFGSLVWVPSALYCANFDHLGSKSNIPKLIRIVSK